jgi:hypothetical protein
MEDATGGDQAQVTSARGSRAQQRSVDTPMRRISAGGYGARQAPSGPGQCHWPLLKN